MSFHIGNDTSAPLTMTTSGGTNTREIVGNGIVLDDDAIEALYLNRELIGRAILASDYPRPQHNGEA